jgi:hypothetical protein
MVRINLDKSIRKRKAGCQASTDMLCGDVRCSLLQVDGAGCGVRGDGYAPQGSPQRSRQRLQEAPRADPHPVCWSVPSIESSVSYPYSFDPDPDPAFEA